MRAYILSFCSLSLSVCVCVCVCVFVKLVVDWLEGLARSGLEKFSLHAAYYTGNVCWENTLHDIKHGNGRDVLVTELVSYYHNIRYVFMCIIIRILMLLLDRDVNCLNLI